MTSKTSTKTFSQQKHSDPPMLWIAAILGSVFLHGFIFWILRLSMIRSQIVSESRSAAVNLVEIVPAQKTLQPTPTNKAQILPSASTKTLPSKSIIVAKIVAKKINKPIGFNSIKTSKIQNNTTQKPVLKRNNFRKNVSSQKLSNTKSFVAVVPSKTKAIKQQVSRRSFVKIPLTTSKYAIKSTIVTQSKPQSIAFQPVSKTQPKPQSIVTSKSASKPQPKPQSIVTSKFASKPQPKPQLRTFPKIVIWYQQNSKSRIYQKNVIKKPQTSNLAIAKRPVVKQQSLAKKTIAQKPVSQTQPQPQSIVASNPVIEPQAQPQSIVATKPVSGQEETPQSIVDRQPVVQERSTPKSTVTQEPIAIVDPVATSEPNISPELNSEPIEKSNISPELNSEPIEKSNISPEPNSEPIEKSNISPEFNSEPIEKPAPKPSISPQPVPIPFPRPIASPAPIRQPVPIPFPRPIASPVPIRQPVPIPFPRPIAFPVPIRQPIPFPRPIASEAPIRQPVPIPFPRPIASPAPIRQPIPFPRPTSPLPNPRIPVRTPQPRESSGVVATLDLSSIRGGNRDIPDQLARPKQNQKQFLSAIDGVQIGSSVVTLDVSLQIDDRGRLAAIGKVKASSSQGSSGGKNINFEAIARQLFRDWEFQPARSGGKPVYSELSLRVTIKPLFGRI